MEECFWRELVDGSTLIPHGTCKLERRLQRPPEFERLGSIVRGISCPSDCLAARVPGKCIISELTNR